MTGSYE